MVIRYDSVSGQRRSKLYNGWLRVDGFLTRSGVFTYLNPNGTFRKEYRPPDEVFNADSLATFALVPVTNDHPPELLTAENTQKYAVGTVGENVRQDGDHIAASVQITDATAVADVEAGKRELSCGYHCDLDETPGEIDGIRYDVVQRRIRGNHVAIVQRARAGQQARLRLDAAVQVNNEQEKETTMKVKINGVEYEVTDQVAQALDAERRDTAEKITTVQKEVDREKARADAATEGKAKAEKDRNDAADVSKFTQRVNDRVALVMVARDVLAPETKLDSMSDKDIKVAVLGKLVPSVNLEKQTDVYIDVRFDIAVEEHKKSTPELDKVRTAASGGGGEDRTDSTGDLEKDARNKLLKHNQEIGTKPIEGAIRKGN